MTHLLFLNTICDKKRLNFENQIRILKNLKLNMQFLFLKILKINIFIFIFTGYQIKMFKTLEEEVQDNLPY